MSSESLVRLSVRSLALFMAISIGQLCVSAAPVFDAAWRGFDTGVFGQGFAPASFAVGDLDGDGDMDILVGDSFAGGFDNAGTGVAVLKNNGDKTFAAPVFYGLSMTQTVGEVALADIDGDGDLDAIATIRGNNDQLAIVRVWRNNGNGTLAASVQFATGIPRAGWW